MLCFYEKAFCTATVLLSQSRKPPGPEFLSLNRQPRRLDNDV